MQGCLTLTALGCCSSLVRSICLGTILPSRIVWNEEIHASIISKQFPIAGISLNTEQQEQEQTAIRHDFSVIQGPPGTGKSFMAAQIATKFARINEFFEKREKVLYCGPSNKSVDVAAGFLKKTDLKVVRVYSTGLEEKLYPNPIKPKTSSLSTDDGKKPEENLEDIALHKLIRKNENKHSFQIREFDRRVNKKGKEKEKFTAKDLKEYSKLVTAAKKIELNKADIIICTCSYSSSLSIYELKIRQCIIDECAMCSEPETILPLVSHNPSQIVLIGDHMQLRPVVMCRKAKKLGLGISLFSRYTEFAGMLKTQYRMRPAIMKLPSKLFYQNQLRCADSVTQRKGNVDLQIFSKSEVIFWNVKGYEQVQHFKTAEEGYKSKYNMAQIDAVIKLLHLLVRYDISPSRIMVLTPYTAQCNRIRQKTEIDRALEQVRIGTIVTSQGSEADYVILSTVRSLPDSSIMRTPNIQWLRKNLGFLSDRNQLNVALTRARDRLFIIGNKNLLGVDPNWGKLLNSYEGEMRAVSDNIFSL